jgi:DNA-binding NarL/FixJ family response regulator
MADPLRVDFLESLNGDVPWVAVVACRRSDRAWEALQLGAGGVAWEDESAAAISERVARAIGGGVFLPPRLGRMPDSQASGLSVDERSLLERLAAPASIGEIAKAVGYSERHLHRLCRSLYTRLDISGRHEVAALLRATRFADPEATPSMQPLESL